MIGFIRTKVKYRQFKKTYKKKNANNNTWAVNLFDLNTIEVGDYSWGGIEILNYDPSHKSNIKIGAFCSIAANTKYMIEGNHRYDRVSTYLFHQAKLYSTESTAENIQTRGDIVVGDDVWIGFGALIMSGAQIGQGAVIGANSIVNGIVPPYSIYIGNKVIKKRFDDKTIELLKKIDYRIVAKKIREKASLDWDRYFYDDVSTDRILELVSILEKEILD